MFMAQEVELYANVNGKKIKETQQIVYHSTHLNSTAQPLNTIDQEVVGFVMLFQIQNISFIHSFISFNFISIHSFWNSFILLFLNHFNCIVFQSFFIIFVFDFCIWFSICILESTTFEFWMQSMQANPFRPKQTSVRWYGKVGLLYKKIQEWHSVFVTIKIMKWFYILVTSSHACTWAHQCNIKLCNIVIMGCSLQ